MAELKRSYHTLAQRLHPDVAGAASATADFQELQRCYEAVLEDARAAFSRELGSFFDSDDEEDFMWAAGTSHSGRGRSGRR